MSSTRTTPSEHAPAAADTSPTLAEHAYRRVKQMIFDFELMPGDRFSESELVLQLDVSRTPLRQALQRLEREGFLQVFPKLGWQVAPLDFDVFDELYDLRVLIECHAVYRLAEAQDRPALEALSQVWLARGAERLSDGAEVGRLDEQFHATLVQAAGNREMVRVHREITDRIRIIRRLDFTKVARCEATYDEHARILRAVIRRRGAEAQQLLRAHIEQSKIEVRQITLAVLYQQRARG